MKKLTGFLFVLVMVFGVVGIAYSGLQTIGTATYLGSDYNLIYEDDSIDGGLVWLDYASPRDFWQEQVDWASGIGSSLTVNLDPGYRTDIDWSTGWRLPLTQVEESYYVNTSEMGHLYYDSLLQPATGPLGDTSPFNNFQSSEYWSGTEYSPSAPIRAWYFSFSYGSQYIFSKNTAELYALAVHPGTVDAVPIPSAIWLLGSGLLGLVGFRRKSKKS